MSGEEAAVKLFSLPSEEGSTLTENNLLAGGAKSFLLEQTPFFRRGLMCMEPNRKSQRCCLSLK